MLLRVVEALAQLSMLSMIGIYFIFSNTIMSALAKVETGAKVMVDINRIILNLGFYTLFFSSAIASIYWILMKDGMSMVAGYVFFIGTFVVTLLFNVPLNNRLLEASSGRYLQDTWKQYLQRWVFWNHVRAACAFAAGVLMLL